MAMSHSQDHILTENIWFAWSKTSYSGDKRRCHQAGQTTTNEQGKVGLLSPWAVGRLSFAIWEIHLEKHILRNTPSETSFVNVCHVCEYFWMPARSDIHWHVLTNSTILSIVTIARTILDTCGIWDTVYNSGNWEPQVITISLAWQLRVAVDDICNLAMLIHFVNGTSSSTSSAAHSWALAAVCGT